MQVDLSLSIASSHSALDKFIGGRSLTTLSEALTVNMWFIRACLTKSSLFMLHFNPNKKPFPLIPSITLNI